MVTCNSKTHFNGTVLNQRNFSEYYYILSCFLLSDKNINDQRKVIKDMDKGYGENFAWEKIAFSCLFRVLKKSLLCGFLYFVYKKF